jgi:beta-barrel assembly-enhancing protease
VALQRREQPRPERVRAPGRRHLHHAGPPLAADERGAAGGVLGHEVGHVAARHQARQISKSTALQAALGIGGAVAGDSTAGALGATGAAIAANLLVLKYSRDMEHEADEVGIKYAGKTGYDPRGMVELLTILLNAEGKGGGGRGAPTFLLTHPATEDRVADVKEHIGEWFSEGELARLTKDTPRFAQVIVPLQPQARGAAAEPVPAGARKGIFGR